MYWRLGFKTPPGGEIGSPHHVLNDHTYCCQLGFDVCESGEPQPEDKDRCLQWHQKKLGLRYADAKAYGIPMIVSEFGACLDSEVCVTEISQVADLSDQYLYGWAYWQFKTYQDLTTSAGEASEGFWNADGTLQDKKVKALSRTYIQAAQGAIQQMRFTSDQDSSDVGTFYAEIEVDTSIAQPSQLYALSMNDTHTWYPHGYDLEVSGKDGASVQPAVTKQIDGNHITLEVTNSDFNGQILVVQIKPKSSSD